MDIVAYTFENDEGRFSVRLRATSLWRIKINDEPFGEPYPTALEAIASLSRSHAVPIRLSAWQPEASYESRFSEI